MPCHFVRIRSKDVGRKGHHYIRFGITTHKGKRGGVTVRIGKPRLYKKRKRR